jgi:hypothetical protein
MVLADPNFIIYGAALKIVFGVAIGIVAHLGLQSSRFHGFAPLFTTLCLGSFILISIVDDFFPFHSIQQNGQYILLQSISRKVVLSCRTHSLSVESEIKGGCRVVVWDIDTVVARSKATSNLQQCRQAREWIAKACSTGDPG